MQERERMMEDIKYKRINTPDLWESFEVSMDNLSIEEGCLRLSTIQVYEFNKDILDDKNLDMSDIAIDECDIIYIIDQKRNLILTCQKDSGLIQDLGCKPGLLPVSLNSPSGIGIDEDSIYITDKDNQRLIALARSNLQIRWILSKGPEGDPLDDVIDLTIELGKSIYILEYGEKRILKIGRDGKVAGEIGSGVLLQPTDIAVDRDGDIYVLDSKKGVHKFRFDGTFEQTITIEGFTPKGLAVDARKQIFIGESSGVPLRIKTIHRLDPDGKTTPLWSYRGAIRRLITDSKGNLYVISDQGSRLTFLKYATKNGLNREDLFRGSYISKPIDSQDPQTRWHRFILEGVFEKGTQTEFSYYISDELFGGNEIQLLPEESWKKGISEASSIQGEERRNALFLEDIQGRYLWFKISLSGNETLSPVVKTLTIFFPRRSYLDDLPATYKEDPSSSRFLERFLSIFESVFYEIDFTVEHLGRFFDAVGTPSDFLSWLGSWLALSLDDNWTEDKKRRLIQNAISLYKKRGTREGLEAMIALFTGRKPPFIVENFHLNRIPQDKEWKKCQDMEALFFPSDKATVGNLAETSLSETLFGKDLFCFCVFLTDSIFSENTLNTIKRIIDDQKPAHTCYGLKVLEPWFYLDMHTYLGVNTTLTKPSFILGKTSVIGRDTVLYDRESAGQMERKSRIGIDAALT